VSIKHILSEIAGYFGSTRGIGHTTAVIKGYNMTPLPVAIVHNKDFGDRVYRGQNYVALDDLASLRGVRRPLVIDNHAFQLICQQALETITDLETENRILKSKIQAIANILDV
jgi:hypothetical protein